MAESTYTPFEATIPLAGGRTLLIQRNSDPTYCNEVFIGYGDEEGVWKQDLLVVGQRYDYPDREIVWNPKELIIHVYGDSETDYITNTFIIDERKEEE